LRVAVEKAVMRVFPGFSSSVFGSEWTGVVNRPDFGSEGWRVTWALRNCVSVPSISSLNSLATMCLRTVRQAVNREVRQALDAIFVKHGRTVTDAMKNEVFELVPERLRSWSRRGSWECNWITSRVRNQIAGALAGSQVAAASALMADLVRDVF